MIDKFNEVAYYKLLSYFKINLDFEDVMQSYGIVTMDNIHDAILTVGIYLDKPLSYYIIKSKQNAIDEYRHNKKFTDDSRIVEQYDYQMHINFTTDEESVIEELIAGVPAYKSKITNNKYKKLYKSILNKLNFK